MPGVWPSSSTSITSCSTSATTSSVTSSTRTSRHTLAASLPIRVSSATGISSSTVCCGGPTNSDSTPWPPATTPGSDAPQTGRFTLERGADSAKDQSYVVHMLDQSALSRTLFPVGDIDKSDVRRLATELGLRTASKPDSQDVCFITSTGGRQTFLGERIPFRRGRVVDAAGAAIGEVDAIEMITVGQRRGIGVPGGGPKRYVLDVDLAERVVVVGDESQLMRDELDVIDVAWTDQPCSGPVRVQTSAHGATAPAEITMAGRPGGVRITWSSAQRRVAAGQSVVFYDGDDRRVLGGGIAVG